MPGSPTGSPLQGEHRAISMQVFACEKAFQKLCSMDPGKASDEGLKLRQLETADQFDRFKIWSNNIAAHRKGTASLDYRLRDASELRLLILDYLEDLEESLGDALLIAQGSRIPWDARNDELLSDIKPRQTTELEQIVSQAKQIVTCLMRLAITIRNPIPQDLIMDAPTSGISFETYDIRHVKEKFPNAQAYLVTRLGKGISQRRQFLKQWRERHEKLSKREALQPFELLETKTEARTETVATTLRPQIKKMSFTEGSFEEEHASDTDVSRTSYASTMNGKHSLCPPPFPSDTGYGLPFECNICFRMTSVSSYDAWKRHVYRDLHPYLCTVEECSMANRLFESRHDWFDHEISMHRGPWRCRLGCSRVFTSRIPFTDHIKAAHSEAVGNTCLDDLIDSMRCKKSTQSSHDCPLCLWSNSSILLLQKHLGRHQHELALFALPLNVAEYDRSDGELSDDSNSVCESVDSEIHQKPKELFSIDPITGRIKLTSSQPTISDSGGRDVPEVLPQTNIQPNPWIVSTQDSADSPIAQSSASADLGKTFWCDVAECSRDGPFYDVRDLHRHQQDLHLTRPPYKATLPRSEHIPTSTKTEPIDFYGETCRSYKALESPHAPNGKAETMSNFPDQSSFGIPLTGNLKPLGIGIPQDKITGSIEMPSKEAPLPDAIRGTQSQLQELRPVIERLWLVENFTVRRVLEFLQEEFNLRVSERTIKRRLREWGRAKYRRRPSGIGHDIEHNEENPSASENKDKGTTVTRAAATAGENPRIS